MDFNKIAQDMMDLQEKLEAYKVRNDKLKDLLTQLLKEKIKLDKKFEKETDELNKLYLQLNIYFIKKMIDNIQNIYKESSDALAKKVGDK